MSVRLHEKLDSFFSYLIGVGIPAVVHFIPLATEFLQFVASFFGALIVVTRYLHDRDLSKKIKGQ